MNKKLILEALNATNFVDKEKIIKTLQAAFDKARPITETMKIVLYKIEAGIIDTSEVKAAVREFIEE